MSFDWLNGNSFFAGAGETAFTLAAALALASGSAAFFSLPHGRLPARLIELARSRVVVYNPGVLGYYEQLLGGEETTFATDKTAKVTVLPDRVYDTSFRLLRFRPNLRNVKTPAQPQGITTNSYGILGPDYSLEKPPHTRRIALFGDSMTQGWGADQTRSFERVVENRLNSSFAPERFELVNFAVTGYTATQILDVAEEDVSRFHPDVWFLNFTENFVSRTWDEPLVRLIKLRADLKYDFLRDVVRRSGASPSDDPLVLFAKLAPYRAEVARDVLAAIKARAGSDGVPLLVTIVPSLEDAEMSKKRLSEAPEMLISLGIPFVDLRNTFDNIFDIEALRINPYDVHPNVRGHAILANSLYSALTKRPDIWQAFAGPGIVP